MSMKPSKQSELAMAMETLASQLLPKIAVLAGAGFKMLSDVRVKTTQQAMAESKLSAIREAAGTSTSGGTNDARVEIVVIGVSTGGPSALEAVLPRLAEDFAVPVMIVQHMPKLFTGELAERLDRHCALRVREARDGAEVRPGTIWLAPGDAHMEVAQAAEGCATDGASFQDRGPASSAEIAEPLQTIRGLPFQFGGETLWRGNAGSGDDWNGFGRADRSAMRASGGRRGAGAR